MGKSHVDFLGPGQAWKRLTVSTWPARGWGTRGCREQASTISPERFLAIQTQMKTAWALWRSCSQPAWSLLRRARTLVSFAAVKPWRSPAVCPREEDERYTLGEFHTVESGE